MPVDYTGLLIAIVVWFGGTVGVLVGRRYRSNDYESWATTLGWTFCTSAALLAFGYFFIWFYDYVRLR
jgi:hypothetical protein